MKIILYIAVLFGAFISTTASSQNILTSNIEWSSVSTFDAQDGMLTVETTKIISTPEQITWYAPDGSIRYSLNITGSDGSWTNVSQNGTIEFNVEGSDKVGVVQFQKVNGIRKVIIHFVLEDGKSIYELKINNVTGI